MSTGGGTRKNASRKKELALALCVSLWMAGGSVAAAFSQIHIDADASNTVTRQYGTALVPGTVTPSIGTTGTTKLTVTGGDWSGDTWSIYGGYSYSLPQSASGYELVLDGVTNVTNVWGAKAQNSIGDAINNSVTLINSTVAEYVYGGDTFTYAKDKVTGNKLYLSGENAVGNVKNFQTINIKGATWGTPVLTLTGNGIVDNETADENLKKAKIDASTLTFANPETVADGATMNLIECRNAATITANLAANTTTQVYDLTPVTGVTINAALNGSLAISGDKKALTYTATSNKATKLTFDASLAWSKGTTYCDLTGKGYQFTFDGDTTIDASKLTFTGLNQTAKTGDAMTLLANAAGITGNHITQPSDISYEFSPLSGVTINGAVTGQIAVDSGNVNYQVTGNNASKLTFGDVAWKDSGALIDHATDATKNIDFDGAAVDTTKINFTNIQSLEANKKMTLVSNFGGKPGNITGEKYTVGTALEGKGKASMVGEDLIFTAETGTGGDDSGLVTQEQTHNAVMGAEVSMAALSMGNDFIGHATDGLSLASNVGADGVSTFAQMGGGSMRQETGSHIDSHTWNAILALGHANKKERGTFEYGAFFEYGTGNYTTQSDDGRGDGSSRYTGGGILGKYRLANGVYVEGSFRAGTVHDDARDVLHDANGVGYSYDTNANYLGAHIGFGKEIQVAGGNVVDVYGKYFYNRRNSVSFDVAAGDHYDLDAVTSQVIRVGARYTMKRDKWNFYGGVAYEHELDGKANGTAGNGGVSAPIRGADISGASFRGELGATMKPGENSPWSLDLNVTGFAGKKQGFTGGVSVAFMF